MSDSHYAVMREVASGFGFHRKFLRQFWGARREYYEMSIFHIITGTRPEPTGKWECRTCDAYFSEPACENFREWFEQQLQWDVLEEYMRPSCPACFEWLEETETERHVEMDPIPADDIGMMSPHPDDWDGDIEAETVYHPCGCRFEIGEERIRWELDQDALERAVDSGEFGFYDGPIFDG